MAYKKSRRKKMIDNLEFNLPKEKSLLERIGEATSIGETVCYIGKELVKARSLAYMFSAVIFFASGFSTRGCGCSDYDKYSTQGVRGIEKEIGPRYSEKTFGFLEIDGETLVLPKTNGKGRIERFFEVEEIVTSSKGNFSNSKTEFKGVFYELKRIGEGTINSDEVR